jgi:hypothetical protein
VLLPSDTHRKPITSITAVLLIFFPSYKYNDQVKDGEMGTGCSKHERNGNSYRILVGKSDGERLGRPRRRWANNATNLTETGWGSMDWIQLVLDNDGFHNTSIYGISCADERLAASQEGLCSMEFVD